MVKIKISHELKYLLIIDSSKTFPTQHPTLMYSFKKKKKKDTRLGISNPWVHILAMPFIGSTIAKNCLTLIIP